MFNFLNAFNTREGSSCSNKCRHRCQIFKRIFRMGRGGVTGVVLQPRTCIIDEKCVPSLKYSCHSEAFSETDSLLKGQQKIRNMDFNEHSVSILWTLFCFSGLKRRYMSCGLLRKPSRCIPTLIVHRI